MIQVVRSAWSDAVDRGRCVSVCLCVCVSAIIMQDVSDTGHAVTECTRKRIGLHHAAAALLNRIRPFATASLRYVT